MKKRKIYTILVVALLALIMVVPVIAVNVPEVVTTVATINITKELKPSDGNIYPDLDTFQFKLEPVSYTLAEDGVVVEDPNAEYMPAGQTVEVTVSDTDSDPSTPKVGTTSIDLNFCPWEDYFGCYSGVYVYKDAGVYTYKLTEIAPNVDGINYDNEEYYVNIYIVNQVDEENIIIGNIYGNYVTTVQAITAWKGTNMSEDALKRITSDWSGEFIDVNSDDEGKFSIGDSEIFYPFENSYSTTSNFRLEKIVKGNYSDEYKDFNFTLTIDDGLNSDIPAQYEVSNYWGIDTITSGVPVDIELSDVYGTIEINDLPSGTTYTIVEHQDPTYYGEYAVDDGGTNATGSANTGEDITLQGKLSDNKYENGVLQDEDITFINTREYAVPTGMVLSATPFVVSIVIVVGMVVLIKRKKQEE